MQIWITVVVVEVLKRSRQQFVLWGLNGKSAACGMAAFDKSFPYCIVSVFRVFFFSA